MVQESQIKNKRSEIGPIELSSVDLLLVSIGDEQVFVPSSEIKEVLRPKALTPVPMGPEHVIGLANIHGQIVCIIDAGGVSSLPLCHKDVTHSTRFLLLRHPVMHVGIWVDHVHKMQQVDAKVLAKGNNIGDSVRHIEVDGVTYDFLQCSKLLHVST
ncbi:MAG: chemotaxis protein CheW [Mariprofundus sp.]|nr:chemotaxis protein CheW [Mariprofundus sp.]